MNKLSTSITLLLLMLNTGAGAVSLNPKGIGEVLIYPYYTVRKDFNTVYTVVNSSDQPKAIKIRFYESLNGDEVLDFNVYLGAHDVWSAVLTPTTSTTSGHIGENTALHQHNDLSCAPFIANAQEFLPFLLGPNDTDQDMDRSTHGYFEVYEMGTVTGASATALAHNNLGQPADCDAIQAAWEGGGYWLQNATTDIAEPTGSLFGHAQILHVSEGHVMAYDALALADFWSGNGNHTEPGTTLPNLNDAAPISTIHAPGGSQNILWDRGIEAVTAVLQKSQLSGRYHVQEFLNGQTEWVISFPTKRWHTNFNVPPVAVPPFTQIWNGTKACEAMTVKAHDLNTLTSPEENFALCYAVNSVQFLPEGDTPGPSSKLLAFPAFNSFITIEEGNNSQLGWFYGQFAANNAMTNGSGNGYQGLPATEFVATKYTNPGAGLGLLAVYSDTELPAFQRAGFVDLIFVDGFEP